LIQPAWIALGISMAIHLLTLGYLFGVLRTMLQRHEKEIYGGNGTKGMRNQVHALKDKLGPIVLDVPDMERRIAKLEERPGR